MKNIKIRAAALLTAASMLLLSACAGGDSSASTGDISSQPDTSENQSASQTDEPSSEVDELSPIELPESVKNYIVGDENEYSADTAFASLYSLGNTERMKEKIEKARSGEKTVVAYIGGSITEGIGAPNKNRCYAKLSCDYFASNYGNGENVEYINAGLSGTSSTLGIVRAERDVFSKSPDIVFIEYGVNDATDPYSQDAYESLVRAALSCESKPAVVLILNRLENGYTAQEHMKLIGEHYGLQIISIADAITPLLDSGEMTWKKYSADSSHPNKYGHRLISSCIANMYAYVDAAEAGEAYTVPETAICGGTFEKISVVTPSDSEKENIAVTDMGAFTADGTGTYGYTESWQLGEGTAPMKITANTNSFIIVYKRNSNGTTGKFDVNINGKPFKTVDTNQSGGWGEAYAEIIVRGDTVRELQIEIAPVEGETLPVDILAVACAG